MKKILLLVLFLGFAAVGSFADDVKNRSNVKLLGEKPKSHSLDKVKFEEFLNFGCPHCNNFLTQFSEQRKKYADRAEFVMVPVLFNGQNDAPLRLFYVAKKLGKQDKVQEELFKAKFMHGVDVFDPGVVNYLARSMGLADEYSKNAQLEWVSQAIKDAQAKAMSYNVVSTPTIVLAESIVLEPSTSMELFIKSVTETMDDVLKPKNN